MFKTVRWVFLTGVVSALAAQAQQPRIVRSLSPDGTRVLLEGPYRGTVTRVGPSGTQKYPFAEILYITEKTLYYRTKPLEHTSTLDASDVNTTAIKVEVDLKSDEGKVLEYRWVLAPAKRVFTPADEKHPPLVANSPDIRGAEMRTMPETEAMFYHAAKRLQQRADIALSSSDARLCIALAKRADRAAAAMKTAKLNPGIADLYATMSDYLEVQGERYVMMKQIVEKQKAEDKTLFARKQAAAARMAQEKQLGLHTSMFGAFFNGSTSYTQGSNGDVMSEYNPDIVGGPVTAIGAIYRAEIDCRVEAGALEDVLTLLSAQRGREFSDVFQAIGKTKAERRERIAAIGVTALALPETRSADLEKLMVAIDKAKAAGKDDAILAMLRKQVEFDRAAGIDNPFSLIDLYQEEARQLGRRNSQQLAANTVAPPGPKIFACAVRAAQAVRILPRDEIFDFDRAEVIRTAAVIACSAPMHETEWASWSRMYTPRAAFAIRLFDAMPLDDAMDPTGEVREQKAMAFLMLGQREAALSELKGIAKLREQSADYHVNRARATASVAYDLPSVDVKAKDRMAKEACADIERAFVLGYSQTKMLRDNRQTSDFASCKTGSTAGLYQTLIALRLTYNIKPSSVKHVVLVTNNSKYAITNVRFVFDAVVMDNEKFVKHRVDNAKAAIGMIAPGASFPLEVDLKFVLDQVHTGTLKIECDQGVQVRVPWED